MPDLAPSRPDAPMRRVRSFMLDDAEYAREAALAAWHLRRERVRDLARRGATPAELDAVFGPGGAAFARETEAAADAATA